MAAFNSDLQLLLSILDIPKAGNHCPCRFCGSSDGLSVFNREGWAFRCHPCGVKGDAAHALALVEGITNGEAFKKLAGESAILATKPRTPAPRQVQEPEAPVIDKSKSTPFFETALLNILQGRADQWLQRRAISREWVEENPNLGFVDSIDVPGWKYPLKNSWIIRVATVDGSTVALKLHRQNAPERWVNPPGCPLVPCPLIIHEIVTALFWPAPEWSTQDPVYVCGGELKAGALCSSGLNATSITSGESSFQWTPSQILRLARRRVVVVYDDDSTGHKFRDASVKALSPVTTSLKTFTFGRQEA